jgi:hypothetical protein
MSGTNPILTIGSFRRMIQDSFFLDVYKLLVQKKELTKEEIYLLLKVALICFNYGDSYLKKFGYRIILRYSNMYRDYLPLYDIGLSLNYIHITKFIENNFVNKEHIESHFNTLFLTSYQENFKVDNIYMSKSQIDMINFATSKLNSFVVVAPTSYGKSEIMIKIIKENLGKKICLLVPTKALLAQTRKNVSKEMVSLDRPIRIVIHPDMYRKDEEFIAVLTQERLLKLLNKDENLKFDILLIDEAHNLLSDDLRWKLLASVIMIVKKRNTNSRLNYFTPFLVDSKSIEIPYIKDKLEEKIVVENIKSEYIYTCDFENNTCKILYYDQFLNNSYEIESQPIKNEMDYIDKYSSNKNIIYLNRPKHIEEIALKINKQNKIKNTEKICKTLSDYLHEDYNLIELIKRGVVYHHGKIPDIVRSYLESIYTNNENIQYIVTSSTLLEGVNIPADKLFVLSLNKGKGYLTRSHFKNLVGRVCRLKEIFNPETGNLDLLEPEIHIVKNGFMKPDANISNFITQRTKIDKKNEDKKENILLLTEEEISHLSEESILNLNNSLQLIENIEPETIDNYGLKYTTTEIGKLCFKNNIVEFDIIKNEKYIYSIYEQLDQNLVIREIDELMNIIYMLFLSENIEFNRNNENFLRLKHEPTRKFYSIVLSWRISGRPYKYMINSMLKHWGKVEDKRVFVDSTWGEIKRNPRDRYKLYVDISKKSHKEQVNLAIVRIKQEQDFIDYNLIKFIDVLNDLNLVDPHFYDRIRFGTDDQRVICLLKNGFTLELAKTILNTKYEKFIKIDIEEGSYELKKEIIEIMIKSNLNEIIIFEAKLFIN